MKRSEFIKSMEPAGLSGVEIWQAAAKEAARLAEAAGVVWEPEAPRIADELGCGVGGDQFLARINHSDSAGRCTGVWFRLDRESDAPFDVKATAIEAVRRYNAWPALWNFRHDFSVGAAGDHLESILRGER